jgi:hypothetical protein
MFDTLLIVVVVFVIGLLAGIVILAKAVHNTIGKQEVEAIHQLAERLSTHLVFLRVEETPNLFLAYDAVSGDFVCQGITMEDLNVNFGLRYPNKKGILVEPESGEASELV